MPSRFKLSVLPVRATAAGARMDNSNGCSSSANLSKSNCSSGLRLSCAESKCFSTKDPASWATSAGRWLVAGS